MRPLILFILFVVVLIANKSQALNQFDLTEYLPEGKLYDCLLGEVFGEAPAEPNVEVYLIRPDNEGDCNHYPNLERIWFSKNLTDIKSKHLNHKLPFKFFINGFNLNGHVNRTWMYMVAQSMVQHQSLYRRSFNKFNYVIIYWQIPGLISDEVLQTVAYYHQTLTKYNLLTAKVAAIIDRLMKNSEKQLIRQYGDKTSLHRYFSRFQFFGHSLGAQVAFHAAQLLYKKRSIIKFGKIVGLDPSLLCFKSGEYGINGIEGRNFVQEVAVIHSSSGLIGATRSPGTTEIVLNGGTFQPNCGITELGCHHSRSWAILNYYDDDCQMVAYACQNMDQFKSGSCLVSRSANHQFKLVNLPEQHFNQPCTLGQTNSTSDEAERMIEELDPVLNEIASGYLNKTNETILTDSLYYVRTGKARHDEGKSHCLQHYQARLVVLSRDTDLDDKCMITSFNSRKSDSYLYLSLSYEVPTEECPSKCKVARGEREEKQQKFVELVPGKLFTSLIFYPGKPNIYTSAVIENINLKDWAECLSSKKIHGNLTFILDISFMSNISPEIRKLFSSLLCGWWTPGYDDEDKKLELIPCNRTQLMNAEDYVDSYLVVGKNNRNDPWYIQLLNGISNAIINWNPLIK